MNAVNSFQQRNFAIVSKLTEIELQYLLDIDNDKDNNLHLQPPHIEADKIYISPGNLVKILQYDKNNKNAKIQVMDYYNNNIIWENLYKCSVNHLKKIHNDLFPFLIAIQDPEDRLQFAVRSECCKNILQLRIDDIVNVSGEPFRKDIFYNCIIRYIGLVPEIGPGYYFGLEILVIVIIIHQFSLLKYC